MKIAILTFDGFNEFDSIVAAHILNRVQIPGWKAEITCPTETVTSMNGVTIAAQRPLEFATEADVVIVGSGRKTGQVIEDLSMMIAFPRQCVVGISPKTMLSKLT